MKRIIKESYDVSTEVVDELRSILSEEYLANEMYRMAIVAMIGNKQHLLEDISEDNGKDELEDHFKNLYEWMQSKGLPVVTIHSDMERLSKGTLFEFNEGMDTRDIVDSLILSEKEAIAHYEDVLDMDEVKYDLRDMLCGFLKDEREHLKKLIDAKNEMGSVKAHEDGNMVDESTSSEFDELQFKLDEEFEDLLELDMMYYAVMKDRDGETLELTVYEDACVENGEIPQAIFEEVRDFVVGLGYDVKKTSRFSISIKPKASEKEDPRQMKFDLG